MKTMNEKNEASILFPYYEDTEYKQLSESACHDLGLDTLCKTLSNDPKEQSLIMNILSNMTSDPRVAEFRHEVFKDILRLPRLRERLTELFERIEFIRNFSTVHKEYDEKLGLWHLLHRLDELNDYICCVEAMRECLSDEDIRSAGLKKFKEHIDILYEDSCFEAMKKDIAELKEKSSVVQSVTLGVNVNQRFEAVSMGLISINDKPFKKSGIVSNFADAIASKDKIHSGTDWDGDMHYHQVEKQQSSKAAEFIERLAGFSAVRSNPFMDARVRATVISAPDSDGVSNATFYLDNILNKVLDTLVRKLRDTLTKYANITILNISQVIPEYIYYIKSAEFISRCTEKGFTFCDPVISDNDASMQAKGLYNLKLAVNHESMANIVLNDLDFDTEHTVYILTGANRGGKTTITQAVGLMFVLAQGGISVPASSFSYKPVDCIYTHFPADEDKTMDLGRLGEECVRFKEIYSACTKDSLLLLNETFSTTSFEEGYYIARDSVKAILRKQIRTIYNTHMHKLAADAEEMSAEDSPVKASSLIVRSEDGVRSFKVEVARPEGLSYARDIAEKYGVTYEMLTS